MNNYYKKAFPRIILPYVIFAVLWILLFDLLLDAMHLEPAAHTQLSILKGWAFVLITAVILSFLLKSETTSIAKAEASRIEAEKSLRESELKYRTLFETAGDAILLMSGNQFIDCNERTLTMFDCTRDQIIGAYPYEFSPPTQMDGRSSLEKAIEKINLALTAGPQTFEWIHCRLDKTPFMAEVSLNRLETNGKIILQAIVRDITERKKAEELLKESELKYRELVENANSIILRWNPNGVVTFINEFGQRFFGFSELELIGRNVVGTIVPTIESTGRELSPLMEQIRCNPKAFEHNINENIKSNGERVWISWTNKAILDEHGELEEILSIGSDITEMKRAEEENRRLHEDLQRYSDELEQHVAERTAQLKEAVERAQAADRIKSAFLATMSHELRTPLNSIIGFTGIMLQGLAGQLNDEQHKQMRMVQSSARHLLALINDVLDISRIEAGELSLTITSFELKPSIEKVVKMVKPFAEKKGLELRANISQDVGTITTDQRRLEQVILNLVNNAIKFTEKGYVSVSCRLEGVQYVFEFADTGIGIKPEEIPEIFEPFRQIDTGLTRKYEGTGLGLSICKKIVDMMGGTIDVESRLGQGSTFTLKLSK